MKENAFSIFCADPCRGNMLLKRRTGRVRAGSARLFLKKKMRGIRKIIRI